MGFLRCIMMVGMRPNRLCIVPTTISFVHNVTAGRYCSTNVNTAASSYHRTGKEDIINAELQKAQSTSKVMELLGVHSSVMNNQHLLTALETLFKLNKNLSLQFSSMPLQDNFKHLCQRLIFRARFYDVDEVISIIKYLNFLGVPGDSAVVQSYLQMLRHSINSLTIDQILFVSFLLQKMTKTALIEALQIALPIVMENQLDQQLVSFNPKKLPRLYLFAVQGKASEEVLNKIEIAIMRTRNFTANDSTLIIWGLTLRRKWSSTSNDLAKDSIQCALTSLQKMDKSILMILLNRLRDRRFYHEEFLKAVLSKAHEESWGLQDTTQLVDLLTYHAFMDTDFLDYYAKLLEESRNQLDLNPKFSVYNAIEAFAVPCYKPPAVVLNAIGNCAAKVSELKERNPRVFLKFALYMSVLEFHCDHILSQVANETFIYNLLEDCSPAYRRECITELQLLQHSTPRKFWTCQTTSVISDIAQEALQILRGEDHEFPLKTALEKALGGSQYVCSGMYSKFGFYIEYLVALRQGGYPIAINLDARSREEVFVEHLELPTESKKIVIMTLGPSNYSTNCKSLNYIATLQRMALKNCGFHVVQICLDTWSQLFDFERIPYLMRTIHEERNVFQ